MPQHAASTCPAWFRLTWHRVTLASINSVAGWWDLQEGGQEDGGEAPTNGEGGPGCQQLQLHSLHSSYGGGPAPCCKGGPGCQSPTSLSSQFLYRVVTAGFTKAAEEMASQDCLEHIKISAGRGFCWERRDLIFVTRLHDFPFSSFKIKTISSCICLFPKTTTFKTRLISQKALFLHFYSIPATQELFPSFFVEIRQKCKTW